MNTRNISFFLGVLCSIAALANSQTCLLSSCNGSDCPNGCTGCASASQVQLSEGKTSQLCPVSGSFCFLGSLSNGVCHIQNCDACSSSDPTSCTGCKEVTSNNSNSNHCGNNQCYSMSYTSVSSNQPPPPPTANSSASSSASSGKPTGNLCVLSSCNSVSCPNGCGNCGAATVVSIPNNGTMIELCPNNASFCFTGSMTDNKCTLANCDGCASKDPASCTQCQEIKSNTANKDWCLNGNCYHMAYSSVATADSSSSTSSAGSGSGTAPPPDQTENCELLQCNSGECPNGCDGCSKATTIPVIDGETTQLCPASGSFCFIAGMANGICVVSSCTSCGGNPNTCTGCQAVTAQNSVSNFCTNSQCYHMGYTSTGGASVGASSTSNGSNGSNVTDGGNGGDSSTQTNTVQTSGIGSGGNGNSNGNGNMNLSSIVSSGLSIRVSLFLSIVAGGLAVLL